MSTTVLVLPPHAKACEPTPGLLALAGHLRRRGLSVRLLDANLEVQEALLSPQRLGREVQALVERGSSEALVTSGRRATRRAPGAVAALRDPRTYVDPRTYRAAVDALAEGYRVLSRASGTRLSISDFTCPGLSPLSSKNLAEVARDPGLVPMAQELATFVPRVLEGSPSLVGVSAVYLSQALPSFALAGLLRKAGYRGQLVLGGGVVSSWAPRLSPRSEIFGVWDALVVGAGEEALETLALGSPRSLDGLPGLLAPGLGAWNPSVPSACPAGGFEPDLDGLPWDRYLAPGPVLPLAASRGCYWGRCAFCPEAAQDRQSFRAASPDALAALLLRARDTHGFRRVHLCDNALPPATLHGLARALRGEGISWYGFARLEKPLLDPAFAEELALGGCVMLQLGVETASQRLLDLLGKGTRIEDAETILRNLSRAGIRTYVYLLFGTPTETETEARQTLEWAATHAESIGFLNLALMNLPKGSALEKDASRYGVTSLEPVAGQSDLSLYWSFSGDQSGDRRHVRRILSQARSHPALRPILARTPPGFTSNHAAFAPLCPNLEG